MGKYNFLDKQMLRIGEESERSLSQSLTFPRKFGSILEKRNGLCVREENRYGL